ncbi:MAG: rhodanese-related sulfurtransferase [Candidatus Endonucleobacter bathymodioli]|uniref:tRNA uridine(34) hydroxylase n=1 Tax=Candidatus Endonucleibacter bathymodioli TaxID=539814 RepID=A0AA90SX64_9GAMM|nr:rhodanese-related sulfurtransferase [Candidatus Endonucleobacter bathymodioli]
MQETVVCALYKFAPLDHYKLLQKPLMKFMAHHKIKGTLLLAEEGINGTVASLQSSIDALLAWLQQDALLQGIEYKLSYHDCSPFLRARVKLKREIVTMGVEGIDPNKSTGTYIKPREWNQLISAPDVLVIDTRNNYEIAIGSFENAVNPQTKSFREFPQYVKENLDPAKHKKVAMFCTGGIRCEKSTAYLKKQGFEEVYHLQGGILKYLEHIPKEESLWQGECFVFDDRVAVDHDLEKGQYDMCHGCRHPITKKDQKSEHFIAGVSCPNCYDLLTDKQRQRFHEREKQIQLAKKQGTNHLGCKTMSSSIH